MHTVNFSETEAGLFTTDEIRRLMRVEFDRAVRYDYPITLFLVEVDRLEYLHHLYGWESREEILHAVIGVLKGVTRASDFLGCMVDNRLMAVFPHAPEGAARAMAGRFLRSARDLRFESDGRSLKATLSIGVAVTKQGKEQTFTDWVAQAEQALRFASDQGGDRFVQREAANVVFEELRQEIEQEAEVLSQEVLEPVPPASDLWGAGQPLPTLAPRIDELFGAVDAGADLEVLRRRVVEAVDEGLRSAVERVSAGQGREHAETVDRLERRLAKLKALLDETEARLEDMVQRRAGEVDTGVASIYRTVQGLSEEDERKGQKKEMLSILFDANKQLRKDIEKRKEEPPAPPAPPVPPASQEPDDA